MDGVIIDSNPAHKVALKQFCKKYGVELSEEDFVKRIYGRTNRDWIINLFGEIDDAQITAYAHEKEALFRELYDDDIRAVEGLEDFLKKVEAAGIPLAIATSAPLENVDFTLEKTGLGKYFPVILYDKFVTRGKPDPEIYLKTAEALGFEPAACLVFEDSLSGITAAKRAGCPVVGVTTTHTAAEMTETDLVIDNFVDLDPKSLTDKLF